MGEVEVVSSFCLLSDPLDPSDFEWLKMPEYNDEAAE